MDWKLTFLFFGAFYEVFIKNIKVFKSSVGRGLKHAKRCQEYKLLVDICGLKTPVLKLSISN